MYWRVASGVHCSGQKDHGKGDTHAHHLGQQVQRPVLGPGEAVHHVPAPQLLHQWVTAPRPDRDLILLLDNIDKAGALDEAATLLGDAECFTGNVVANVLEPLRPLDHDVVLRQAAVVRPKHYVHLELVDPSAGLYVAGTLVDSRQGGRVLVDLAVQGRPVGDAAQHGADVNQVEVVRREGPQLGDVVDLELAVLGDELRLDRRQVDAEDVAPRELVGEVAIMR